MPFEQEMNPNAPGRPGSAEAACLADRGSSPIDDLARLARCSLTVCNTPGWAARGRHVVCGGHQRRRRLQDTGWQAKYVVTIETRPAQALGLGTSPYWLHLQQSITSQATALLWRRCLTARRARCPAAGAFQRPASGTRPHAGLAGDMGSHEVTLAAAKH